MAGIMKMKDMKGMEILRKLMDVHYQKALKEKEINKMNHTDQQEAGQIRREHFIKHQAGWAALIAKFPIGTEVSYCGERAWITDAHVFPAEGIGRTDFGFCAPDAGSITLTIPSARFLDKIFSEKEIHLAELLIKRPEKWGVS